jgi:hypothetical protein
MQYYSYATASTIVVVLILRTFFLLLAYIIRYY